MNNKIDKICQKTAEGLMKVCIFLFLTFSFLHLSVISGVSRWFCLYETANKTEVDPACTLGCARLWRSNSPGTAEKIKERPASRAQRHHGRTGSSTFMTTSCVSKTQNHWVNSVKVKRIPSTSILTFSSSRSAAELLTVRSSAAHQDSAVPSNPNWCLERVHESRTSAEPRVFTELMMEMSPAVRLEPSVTMYKNEGSVLENRSVDLLNQFQIISSPSL